MHTGTPFHFKLPQGNIHPRTCITPPSQRLRPCLFSQMDSNSPSFHPPSHPRVTHLTGDNSVNDSITMLSPSELSSSFFRPITPLQSQQLAGNGSQNLVVSNEVDMDRSDVLMDTSESAAVTRDGQNSRNPIGEERFSVSKTAAHSSEAVSSKGDEQSSRTQTPNQQSAAAVLPPTTVSESEGEDTSGRHAGTNVETVKDLSSLPCHSSSGKIAEPSLKSSSPEKQTTTQSSPRKCLSLRKTKNSPTPAKLRTANGGGLQSDKTIQPVLNGATCSKTGVRPFVLGVDPQQDASSEAEQNSCGSQGLLPPINLPNDSQFELSESSPFSPPTFRIERPPNPNHQLNIPPSSMTRHPDTNAKTSIFSNLGASSRKKATSYSLVTAVSGCRSAWGADPYQFHSQSQNSDVAQFMRRKDLSSKGREGGDEGERRGVGEESVPMVNCNSIHRSGEEGGFMRSDNGVVSGPSLCQNEDVHPPSQDVANSTANTHCENRGDGEDGDRGGGVEASPRDYSEVAPAGQREAPLSTTVTLNPSQLPVPTTDPQQPAVSPLPVVGTSPSLDPSTTTPVTSPTSPTLQGSALQFVSPSVVATNLGLEQWVQQAVGGAGGSYEIQYVRTYTIECKVVSSHVIKDERVVAGSARAWQVREVSEGEGFIFQAVCMQCVA